MEAKSIYGYYWFGTCLRYLQDASEGTPVHGEDLILSNAEAFFRYLKELNLAVTRRAASDLRDFQGELGELPKEAELTRQQSSRLQELMGDIRKTLEAEIQGIEAFIVTPKRYDIKRLLEDIGSLLAPGVYRKLPEIARYDFAEAGKCIAFERPTAAAFHILRATEAVLKYFYLTMIRRNRITNLMWGPIVQDLRKHRKTQKHEVLYSNLDNIRRSFRNPTQHPDMTYDIHEVQDLLPLCIETINRMVKIMPKQ